MRRSRLEACEIVRIRCAWHIKGARCCWGLRHARARACVCDGDSIGIYPAKVEVRGTCLSYKDEQNVHITFW